MISLKALDILRIGVEKKASDIYIKAGSPPAMRVTGTVQFLEDVPSLTSEDTARLAREIMNDQQWEELNSTHEIDMAFTWEGVARFRVNGYFQRGSIGMVIRVISLRVPSIEDLMLPSVLKDIAMTRQGLVLVTGPTGCGKSTTLASMINYINENKPCSVVTIEEPIEYVYEDKKAVISQREVGIDTASFQEALRRVVRQNPDVILIGEMRDVESFNVALTAAETGHLVFSTVHTASAVETLDRIVNMFPPPDKPQISMRLAGSLRAILSQKLIPTVDKTRLVPAVEVLVCTPTVSKYIEEGRFGHIYDLIREGGFWGMQTMNQALYKLYKDGYISEEEALANAGVLSEMRQILRKG